MDEQVDNSARRRAAVVSLVVVVAVLVAVVGLALIRGGASQEPGAMGSARPSDGDAARSSAASSPEEGAASSAGGEDAAPAAGAAADDEEQGAALPGAVPVPPVSDVAPIVVDTTARATTADGLSVTVVSVAPADVTGTGPGEYAGPGMVVGIRVVNDGETAVALGSPAVGVYSGAEGSPVSPVLTDPDTVLLPAEVGAGDTVEGSYRFAQPTPAGADLAVRVLLSPSTEPVVAQGFRLG